MTKIKEKYKDWNKVFQIRKKYSSIFPFCFYDLAEKYLPKDKKAVIIDIGCGSCKFEDYLNLWQYKNLTVLDGNLQTINELKEKYVVHNIIEYIAPNRLPFENESVDYVFCSHLIEHFNFKELYKLFKEFDRVLKNNGILVVNTPLMWVGFYRTFDHVKPYPSLIFDVYFCGLKSGNSSYKPISKNYEIKELVYRYNTSVDISSKFGSNVKIFDFIIQSFRYVCKGFGIKKYIRTGYTIILRKENGKL